MANVYYRIPWHSRDTDGAISVRASWWDDDGHSVGVVCCSSGDDDYPFWEWIIRQPDMQRTLKDDELVAARLRFAFESSVS